MASHASVEEQSDTDITLDDLLAQEVPSLEERVCAFEDWLRQVTPSQRAGVQAWIDTVQASRGPGQGAKKGNINGAWISRQISRLPGVEFSSHQVNRHIREPKECGCSNKD